MAATWLILLVGLAVQLILALFTAKDAHSRGHDRDIWFVLVFIFGILAILIYLLTRNDTRIPESDRPETRDFSRLRVFLLYFGVTIVGLILFSLVGNAVAEQVHPMPENSCETEEVDYRGEQQEATVCDNPESDVTQMNKVRDKRNSLREWFNFFGMVVPPASLFAWRRY